MEHYLSTHKKKINVLIIIGAATYLLVGTLLIYNHHLRKLSGIESLSFGYGSLLQSLIHIGKYEACGITFLPDEVCFTTHRLPFITYYLWASYYLFSNNLYLIALFKNLLFFLLLLRGLLFVYSHIKSKKTAILLFIFVLTFPRWILHFFQINTEEPYIIPFLAYFSAFLFFESRVKADFAFFLVSCIGLLYSKNSLLYITAIAPLLVWMRYKNRSMTWITLFVCVGGIVSLAYFNYSVSGKFTAGSSWEGWNLYKGNNSYTLGIYPTESLDMLDERGLIPIQHHYFKNEWEFSDYLKEKAFAFIQNNPFTFLRLVLLKTWLFFLIPYSPPCCSPGGVLTWVNNLYLLLFRLVFWYGIVLSLYKLYKGYSEASVGKSFGIYLAILCLFSGFYIIGFVYERHITPIILPAIFYVLKLLDSHPESLIPGGCISKQS